MQVYVVIKTDAETNEFIRLCGVYSDKGKAYHERYLLEQESIKYAKLYGCDPDEVTVYEKELEE